jgi:hypothetical protein
MHHITRQVSRFGFGAIATAPRRRAHRLPVALLAACLALAALTAGTANANTVPKNPAPGVYTISPAHTHGTMVLDVAGAVTGPAPIGQWKKYGASGNPNQRFRIEKVATDSFSPVYRILPQHAAGMCLDIAYADEEVGAKLIQHGCNGQKNQQFYIEAQNGSGNGTYTIAPRHSGLFLEVPGRSYAMGTQLDQNVSPFWPPAIPPDYMRFVLTKVAN